MAKPEHPNKHKIQMKAKKEKKEITMYCEYCKKDLPLDGDLLTSHSQACKKKGDQKIAKAQRKKSKAEKNKQAKRDASAKMNDQRKANKERVGRE